MSDYYDIRTQLFRDHFERAYSYTEYINTGSAVQQERWRSMRSLTQLTAQQTTLIESFTRKIHILVLSGIWCGDCLRQGALLDTIASKNDTLRLRFIDNRANKSLQDELRINGAEKVPVVTFLSEDFFEIARFGDRHLSVYREKAKTELGAACELGNIPPSTSALALELQEWLDYIERVHLLLRLSPMLRKRYND